MPTRNLSSHPSILAVAISLSLYGGARGAGSFTISNASTTAQTLNGGQTGTITSTGSLTVSGGTVAITLSGSSNSPITITNSGTLKQTGTGRAIRDNTGGLNVAITNNAGALIQTADADGIQMAQPNSTVTLDNFGSIISLNASAGGSQAVDWAALTLTNALHNYSTGVLQATEADAVRPGVGGTVINDGLIKSMTTTGSSSDGVDAQNNSGIVITNTGTGTIDGGRHGITGGALNNTVLFTTSVTNNLGGIIKGNNGSGINLDGFNAKQTAIVINNGSITGNGVTGDGDGVDVDGLINLTNTGTIKSLNSFSSTTPAFSEGITVGGGSILNSGLIEGDVAAGNNNAVGRGISLVGNDSLTNPGTREALYGNATVTNQSGGVIRGQTDSGIFVGGPASGFAVTITNQAGGIIRGGGATAAIQTGADNDVLNNAGAIIADGTGKAIDLGDGNDSLNVTGGAASIVGDVSGGTGNNSLLANLGSGNVFTYAGSLSNFSLVQAQSGTVRLTGVSTYTGTTKVTGRLELQGNNRISAASALDLGGYLKVTASGPNGQTFASLTLSDNSIIDLDNSTSLTFGGLTSFTLGKTLGIVNYTSANSPDYAVRFLGDLTANQQFLDLLNATTVNGASASDQYDGTYTDVFAAVPEPASVGFGLALVALLGCARFGRTRAAAR